MSTYRVETKFCVGKDAQGNRVHLTRRDITSDWLLQVRSDQIVLDSDTIRAMAQVVRSVTPNADEAMASALASKER